MKNYLMMIYCLEFPISHRSLVQVKWFYCLQFKRLDNFIIILMILKVSFKLVTWMKLAPCQKNDIILMIGSRSFSASKKKKHKVTETKKSVRATMQLTARVYLVFRDAFSKQNAVTLTNMMNNAADMYRREGKL